MKTEEEIKKIMVGLKDSLPKAPRDEFIILQTQYNTLEWVLDEKEEEKADE